MVIKASYLIKEINSVIDYMANEDSWENKLGMNKSSNEKNQLTYEDRKNEWIKLSSEFKALTIKIFGK